MKPVIKSYDLNSISDYQVVSVHVIDRNHCRVVVYNPELAVGFAPLHDWIRHPKELDLPVVYVDDHGDRWRIVTAVVQDGQVRTAASSSPQPGKIQWRTWQLDELTYKNGKEESS